MDGTNIDEFAFLKEKEYINEFVQVIHIFAKKILKKVLINIFFYIKTNKKPQIEIPSGFD